MCATLALATLAVGGHATGSPLTSVTLAIHLLAAVTWLGAVPAVALVLWDERMLDGPEALDTVRRFSRTATVTLLLVFGGGVASALLLTNGLEGGVTVYVWIALAKIGVVGAAALLGRSGDAGSPRAPSGPGIGACSCSMRSCSSASRRCPPRSPWWDPIRTIRATAYTTRARHVAP